MSIIKKAQNHEIKILCWEINKICDLISQHTSKANKKSLCEIQENSTAIYWGIRELLHENQKLSALNQNMCETFSKKGIFKHGK